MAKKKAGGTSIGLIMTLIFFILATFITGTVAYFGYADQKQFQDEAEKAKTGMKDMEKRYREERVRKIVLRIAMGIEGPNKREGETESDSDRFILVTEMDTYRPQIKDEYDRLLRNLDDKLPNKEDFKWKLLGMKGDELATKGANDPDVAPQKTIPQIVEAYKTERDKFKAAETAARQAEKGAINQKDLAVKQAADQKASYDADVAKLTAKLNDFQTDLQKKYNELVAKHRNDNVKADEQIKKQGADIKDRDDLLVKKEDTIKDLKAINQKNSLIIASQNQAVGVDAINLEEKKGEIIRRDENGFVTVNIGSSKRLKAQTHFLVVQSSVSWLALLEKEKALDKAASRNDRQPFEDNPYVKAGIEIVEVTGPESARAKVTFENEPIRNPIQAKDQIFNLAWQPNEEIRIAFAGIIDLDGDGLDNNEDFLRLLERQGVVVDEYLRMKPLEFVKRDGKGMTLRTKYLVIAPDPRLDALPSETKDTPQTIQIKNTIEKMGDIKLRARELGIQMIEARKFLAMIGYKLPPNPVPPSYGAAVYIDPLAPAPMEKEKEPKKEPKEKN